MNCNLSKKLKLIILILFTLIFSCKDKFVKNYIESGRDNSKKSLSAPLLILISLDGFRYDYIKKFNASNLKKLKRNGSYASSLVPVYPSKTFPNHISTITGRYPSRSGILSNTFYDPQKKMYYIYYKSEISSQSHWYKGQSLWSVCMQNELRSAAIFWPGSEAKIGNFRPGFYMTYDKTVDTKKKIATLIHLLKLKKERRPHFITLYFNQPDLAGHKFGPDAVETKNMVLEIDKTIGQIINTLQEEEIKANIIITSDHGMQSISEDKVIDLNKITNLKGFIKSGHGSQVFLYARKKKGRKKLILKTLQKLKKNKNLRVYLRKKSPLHWHMRKTELAGDIIVDAKAPYYIQLYRTELRHKGTHGWDAKYTKSMHGIFIASGPDIRSGLKIKAVANIDIYPFVLKLLRLSIPKDIDANPKSLEQFVK